MTSERFQGSRLTPDSFVLRQQHPTAGEPVPDPFRVADPLAVVVEALSHEMDYPTVPRQRFRCALSETPVGEELRQRPG